MRREISASGPGQPGDGGSAHQFQLHGEENFVDVIRRGGAGWGCECHGLNAKRETGLHSGNGRQPSGRIGKTMKQEYLGVRA